MNERVQQMPDYAARREVMVDTQVRPADVTKVPVIHAMREVPREAFVPPERREAAYIGENLDLGGGRVLLDPRTFAKMLDALNVTSRDLVLDVGCAMGYSAAVLCRLAEAVVAVEEDEAMAGEAQGLLAEHEADGALVHTGPLAEGAAQHGPYDAIIVEGGVGTLPQALIDQLKDGGRIGVLFMEGALGVVRIGYRQGRTISWRFTFNASAPVLPGFARTESFAL